MKPPREYHEYIESLGGGDLGRGDRGLDFRVMFRRQAQGRVRDRC